MPVAADKAYALRGDFLEVCNCKTICPCWTGRAPDEEVCTGVFAWVIDDGEIDGVEQLTRYLDLLNREALFEPPAAPEPESEAPEPEPEPKPRPARTLVRLQRVGRGVRPRPQQTLVRLRPAARSGRTRRRS